MGIWMAWMKRFLAIFCKPPNPSPPPYIHAVSNLSVVHTVSTTYYTFRHKSNKHQSVYRACMRAYVCIIWFNMTHTWQKYTTTIFFVRYTASCLVSCCRHFVARLPFPVPPSPRKPSPAPPPPKRYGKSFLM